MSEENKQLDLGTHQTTTRNEKQPKVNDPKSAMIDFKRQLSGDYEKQITNYFHGKQDEALKFMSAVVHSVRKTPALLECDRASLLEAFMACAEYRLYPSEVSGEAYIIPYNKQAQFQLGYQGVITLLYRSGVDAVWSDIVYENDDFNYEKGLNPRLEHKPNINSDRGKPVAVYAVVSLNGQKIFNVMSKEEVMKFKTFSKSKGSDYSPWNPNRDPELWMWKKTCIKQLAKSMPKNETIKKAIEKENEDSIISNQKPQLDAEGPAVGRALHEPDELEHDNNESNEQ